MKIRAKKVIGIPFLPIEEMGIILYKISLDVAYITIICTVFGYYNNFKLDVNIIRYAESWVLCLALILLTPRKKSIISYYLLMQLVIMIIPMLSIYGLHYRSRYFLYLVCGVHMLQCFIGSFFGNKCRPTVTKNGKNAALVVLLFLLFLTLGITFLQFGIPDMRALDFNRVYEVRAENQASGILNYLSFWLIQVILPVLLLEALMKKKFGAAILVGAVVLYFYLIFAHKSWFFSAFFIAGVYFFVRKGWFVKGICLGMPAMVFLLNGLYACSSKFLMLVSLFIRRVLFVPADIKFEYYDFFSKGEKLFFSEGQIGKLFGMESPYNQKAALIIGDRIGSSGGSANTGYLAYAYADLGTVGVILFGVLLVVLLKFLDSITRKESFVFNFSVLSLGFFSLNDQALLTRLLTGGMALMMLILVLRSEPKRRKISCSKDGGNISAAMDENEKNNYITCHSKCSL